MGWEDLYQLALKDAAGAPVLRRQFAQASSFAVSVDVSATIFDQTDSDSVFLILNAALILRPGAAQAGDSGRLAVVDLASGTELAQILAFTTPRAINAVDAGVGGPCFFPLFSGERVAAVGRFSAGGAANTVLASITGWEIPRGNLQR